MGNAVTSITLLINNVTVFSLVNRVTLNFASGFVIAANEALRLLGITNYYWRFDSEKQPITTNGLLNHKKVLDVVDDKHLANLVCEQIRKPSYIVWVKNDRYEMHRFETKSEVLQFMQGVLTTCNSFNVAITEIIARPILRTRFVNGSYAITYFDIDGYALPSYNMSEIELTTLCNVGVTIKSSEERLHNLRIFLQNKWRGIKGTPDTENLINALLVDMAEIIKYIHETADIETLEIYLGFRHDKTGPQIVRKYLETFDLQ